MPEIFEVSLPSGEVLKGHHWAAEGATRNLVMITGMQEYSLRYDDYAKYLVSKGINVYILDAFGQGLNAPAVDDLQKWPVDAFAKTVEALNIKINEVRNATGLPTYLMGHSMGSFISQSYLETYPNTADKVVLCGSNGPRLALMKMGYTIAKIVVNKKNWDKPSKLLTSLSLGPYAKAVKNRKTDLDWLSVNEENVQAYIADPYLGHTNTNGFMKEFLKGMSHLYEKKNIKKISSSEHILLVAGEGDPVGDMSKGVKDLYAMYKKQNVEDVTMIIYPNMRHEIINETDHQIVYDDIVNFLLK